MLEAGIKGKKVSGVTEHNTAKAMGSGTLEVFATPAMVALMEGCAYESVLPFLEEGTTPVGMKVVCESELVKVDGRELTFNIKVFDEKGLIGEGEHQRFVVYNEKFQEKANNKLTNLEV